VAEARSTSGIHALPAAGLVDGFAGEFDDAGGVGLAAVVASSRLAFLERRLLELMRADR
jgi:hypothetical protein